MRVEVPDPVTDVGLSEAVTTDGALTVRATVPEKPPRDPTVMVLVADDGHVVDTIEVGLTVADRPADGLGVRVTVPVNPLTGATVIVTVAEAPALTVTLVVLAVMVKSVTF